KADIEISRVNATDFFKQNTTTQFGVDFDEISLFSLVQYEVIRQRLEEAQKALDENNIDVCIKTVAIAFYDLIHSYESSKSIYYGSSPFYFGKDMTFLSASSIGIGHDRDDSVGRKLGNFVDTIKNSMTEIQKAVKIMSFGIDYKKYAKFKLLTPNVKRTIEGKHIVELWGKKKWTKENCQYCIDFVLESSLKLQEFDFDINEII